MTSFPHDIALSAEEIHVVRLPLDVPIENAAALLDDNERERAASFRLERDRRRFVAAHAYARIILGRVLRCPPAWVAFASGTHGKPVLRDAAGDIRFNLSHAGERGLLAVARSLEVGVDIEEENALDELALAKRFFSPAESCALATFPDRDRRAAFFRGWTRKEAFVKALGKGLSCPLDRFEVSLDDSDARQLLRCCDDDPLAPERWRIVALAADPGYAAALAAAAGSWRVTSWDMGSDVSPRSPVL